MGHFLIEGASDVYRSKSNGAVRRTGVDYGTDLRTDANAGAPSNRTTFSFDNPVLTIAVPDAYAVSVPNGRHTPAHPLAGLHK